METKMNRGAVTMSNNFYDAKLNTKAPKHKKG